MQPLEPIEPREHIEINPIGFADPIKWLAMGLRDMVAQPRISLFYGVCFWIMALFVNTVFHNSPEYTLSAISGSLLVGPFLAMGLYDVSMQMERCDRPSFRSSMRCWIPHIRSMSMLVMVVVVMELIWGRASLIVFAVFFNSGGMPTTASVLEAVFNPQNWEFIVAYICVGGFFAGLVFSSMMVSIPMILDRDTDAITACLTSLRVFFDRTPVALFWGLLIALMVGGALWLSMLGLLLVGPWLGFASWHAYRGSVRVTEAVSIQPLALPA